MLSPTRNATPIAGTKSPQAGWYSQVTAVFTRPQHTDVVGWRATCTCANETFHGTYWGSVNRYVGTIEALLTLTSVHWKNVLSSRSNKPPILECYYVFLHFSHTALVLGYLLYVNLSTIFRLRILVDLADRGKVRGSLCYAPGVGVRT